ncbi:MAG: hypothetical protein M1828_002518 [Chrysothrix sp. TS-e1954]|nr:MAG: hypothetical protein M1828_002518 [Chrysothrix sp. TS-e1954]
MSTMDQTQTTSAGNTPDGTSAPRKQRFKRKAADPLIQPKRRPQPRPQRAPQSVQSKPPGNATGSRRSQSPATAAQTRRNEATSQPSGNYTDIPIVTTKRELLEGVGQHVFRFLPNISAKVRDVNPMNEDQFVRPIRLHRRDPHEQVETDGIESSADAHGRRVDDKEREKQEILKAERKAEREANQAQIAPVAKQNKTKEKFRKQTEQVFLMNDSERRANNMALRYQEALPWHLEDFDMKNIWQGTYESALSETFIALVESPGHNRPVLRMQPLDKWYKMSNKNKTKKVYTGDEVEKRMKAKYKEPKFLQAHNLNLHRLEKERQVQRKNGSLFTRVGERGERATVTEDNDGPEMAADVDDLDYNEKEDFADDEDNELFEGQDEDTTKEAEEKIKREQREANAFELKEEKDYDAEEAEDKRKENEAKKLSKGVQKSLMRHEKNFVYEEDSEGNPYSSSSESDDSETERLNEEQRKKDGESNPDADKAQSVDKPTSGASTKGTNTPSGRPSKHDGPLRTVLKRPGSPNLSEASGSESAKKKLKKNHLVPNGSTISRTATPLNAPGSPGSDTQRSGQKRPVASAASSGSDGETSDAKRRVKKQKLGSGLPSSQGGSPNTSRPGSPRPVGGQAVKTKKSKPPPGPLPSVEQLRNSIPDAGCSIATIAQVWKTKTGIAGFSDALKLASYQTDEGPGGSKWLRRRQATQASGSAL